MAKIGAGHMGAMGRMGFGEIRDVFVFPDSNLTQPTEYGLVGTKTPGEVQAARQQRDDASPSGYSAIDNRMPTEGELQRQEPEKVAQIERD